MAPRTRMKLDARRRQVLEAAMHEFGRAGFDTVSVTAIADRAGVSQPYVFQLFGTKKDLFLAAIEERTQQVLEAFRTAAAEPGDGTTLDAMGGAYVRLLEDNPLALRCQLHSWAAASDEVIGAASRSSYIRIWKEALALSGEDPESVRDFMAKGMLMTVVSALDIPELFAEPHLLQEME